VEEKLLTSGQKESDFSGMPMQLTRAADYAVRVMIHLAGIPAGTRGNRDSLSQSTEVPAEFLGKVLQALGRANLIKSYRGAQGGFELARPAEQITMLEVIEAIEGPLAINLCLAEDGACGRRWWCPAHAVWKEAQEAMSKVLGGVTVAQLAVSASGVDWSVVHLPPESEGSWN
jgi:Rrf2 family protein